MVDKLFELVKKYWLKPKSIPAAFSLLCAGYVILISKIMDWDGIQFSTKTYLLFGLPFAVLGLVYILACLICNRLPRASKNTQAVLFVIEAESPQLFDAVRFKLVDNFNAYIENGHEINFKAICIEKKQIKNYNLASKDDAISLLIKTNCLFLVSVRYSADDINNAETFELGINNYGVRHPLIGAAARAILSNDIATLKTPIGKQKFSKPQTISVFNFTTQTLIFACQYILGFAYLLSGDTANAHTLLKGLRDDLLTEHINTSELKHLKNLVDDRLFATMGQIATDCMQDFKRDKNLQHLNAAYAALTSANQICPDTYFYNLNMAYVHIMLYKDLPASKACIEKCKQTTSFNKEWLYSEAFLSAYAEQAPGSVIAKYERAFEVPYDNLVEIVEYIEFILDREPEKTLLHLAAGLVYGEIGDAMLMKRHLSIYKELSPGIPRRIENVVNKKILTSNCNATCDHNCKFCSRAVA